MSLFDTVLDAVQNQTADNAGANGNMMATILGLLNSPELGGSLTGLITKFSQAGLSEQVASWVGTGKNIPVSGGQIQTVLGCAFVQDFAQKLGINPDDAARNLAKMLPQVIDKLTPNGEVSKDGNLMELGMSALSGFLGKTSG
jgi:uncharacterized protein YidB (DUF937 family)